MCAELAWGCDVVSAFQRRPLPETASTGCAFLRNASADEIVVYGGQRWCDCRTAKNPRQQQCSQPFRDRDQLTSEMGVSISLVMRCLVGSAKAADRSCTAQRSAHDPG